MLSKIFVAALAFAGFCSAAPLDARAPAAITAREAENGLLDVQLGYQTVSDHVVFLGPDAPPGIGNITVVVYKDFIDSLQELPTKSGATYAQALQFSLCNAATTYTLQLLKTHALLRQYAPDFTAKERKRVIAVAKLEQSKTAKFSPTFEGYVPVCKKSIEHNGEISIETIKDTILVFEGKTPT